MTAKEKESILEYFFKHIAKNYKIASPSGLRTGHENDPLWKSSMITLEERVASGWTVHGIADRLVSLRDTGVRYSRLCDAVPLVFDSSNEKASLLDKDRTYVHSALKIILPSTYDDDTGEIINAGEVRRVNSFTFGDLVDYYIDTLKPEVVDRKRLAGTLKHYLSIGTDLDVLLRAIDLWEAASTEASRGNNPFDLSGWIEEAISERDGMVSPIIINDENVE